MKNVLRNLAMLAGLAFCGAAGAHAAVVVGVGWGHPGYVVRPRPYAARFYAGPRPYYYAPPVYVAPAPYFAPRRVYVAPPYGVYRGYPRAYGRYGWRR